MSPERPLTLLTLAAFGVGACSLLTDLSSLGGGDASVDAPLEAPADTFVLSAKPQHVTLDPGESIDISISIVRGATFTDIVDLAVNDMGGLSNVQTSPTTLTFTASAPVNLHLDVSAAAKAPQDGNITVLGIGRSTQKSASTAFGVRIGSLFVDTQTNETVTLPAYVSGVTIKAWGAGGAAGSSYDNTSKGTMGVGGAGGAGGMAGAFFALGPGTSLDLTVGAPGRTGAYGTAGSGGGYSAVMVGATTLLIAGGGGGGGQGGGDTTYCNSLNGGDGFAGGGANAQTSLRSATTTAGGVAGDANATAGTALQGGAGSPPPTNCGNFCSGYIADGGAPGGGRAGYVTQCRGSAGGGGGGGFYGGGGGGATPNGGGNGGGGGSGYVGDAGADVMQFRGTGSVAAATTDPDYVAGTGSGGIAAPDTSTPAVPPNAGRIRVRLPKP